VNPLDVRRGLLRVVDPIGQRGRRPATVAPEAPALFEGRPLYHGSPRHGLTVLKPDLPMAQRTYPGSPHGALGMHVTTNRGYAASFAKAKAGNPPGVLYVALAPPRHTRHIERPALMAALGEDPPATATPGTPQHERALRNAVEFRRALIAQGYDSIAVHRPGRPEPDEIVYLVDVPVLPATKPGLRARGRPRPQLG
jgi:hypothetical protein